MWVKTLSLNNIQCYENETIEFSKGINIIVGENNSGKSTIIKSLLKLQSGNHTNNVSIRKLYPYGVIQIYLEESETKYFGTRVNNLHTILPEEDSNMVIFRLNQFNNEAAFFLRSRFNNSINISEDSQYAEAFDSNGRKSEGKVFNPFPSEEEHNFIYPYLAQRKTGHYDERTDHKTSYNIESNLRSLAAKIQYLTNGSHPENKNFIQACKEILGFEIGLIPGSNGSKVGVVVKGGEVIPIENMGDGVGHILGLITILLSDEGKLFLIEEPENDIHPKALKKLLELILRKANANQFVISTHSNIVLQYLGTAKNSKILKTETVQKIANIPTSKVKDVDSTFDAKRDVLEELGYNLLDYNLYSGYLILEEASAETIINEILIPLFTPNLSKKLRTISAKGISNVEACFNDFQRLFVFTHLEPTYKNKSWVIVDGDEKGIETVEKLKANFQNWDQNHFKAFSQTSFEYYYPERFQAQYSSIIENSIKDKREEKKALLAEVLSWAKANKGEAEKEFQKSALEVISILKEIDTALSK